MSPFMWISFLLLSLDIAAMRYFGQQRVHKTTILIRNLHHNKSSIFVIDLNFTLTTSSESGYVFGTIRHQKQQSHVDIYI